MTTQEISKLFNIPIATIKYYETIGLFEDSGAITKRLSLFLSLKNIGLYDETILEYFKLNDCHKIKFLSKQRGQILDNIHLQQKNLDVLDYLIYDLKHGGRYEK